MGEGPSGLLVLQSVSAGSLGLTRPRGCGFFGSRASPHDSPVSLSQTLVPVVGTSACSALSRGPRFLVTSPAVPTVAVCPRPLRRAHTSRCLLVWAVCMSAYGFSGFPGLGEGTYNSRFISENPSEPFGASVTIDGVTYGSGTASSKKLAKNKAGNALAGDRRPRAGRVGWQGRTSC